MKNTIQFDPSDPRLTAFALGELEGAERREIETMLAESEEAARFVSDVQGAASALTDELAREDEEKLTPEQRARIERALDKRATPRRKSGKLLRRIVVAATAVLVTGLGATWYFTSIFESRSAPYTYTLFGGGPPARGHAPAPSQRTSKGTRRHAGRALDSLGYAAVAYGGSVPGDAELIQLRALGYIGYVETPVEAERPGTEAYESIAENAFTRATVEPLSTFSIDVDTASYSNTRRFVLGDSRLPPPSSIRVEEFINYFRYDYGVPTDGRPFAVHTDVASAPWQPDHSLVRIALRAEDIAAADRPASNLVFLIDVSGSMNAPDKLPLLQRSMKLLVEELDERDSVSLVVYASATGLVLPPTSCADKWVIMEALDRLKAGGSTNGGAGIGRAYQAAREAFLPGGINRIILCTDGDFNVGITGKLSLTELIEKEREDGIFLSVLGFGRGNLKDSTMENLADRGNGNYAYIDSIDEARKVLVTEMGGTLQAIAKDVKIQVEFNPAEVQAWRLIGYENRLLAHQDFNDDTKDAGEIGAGLTVTALYEVVPHGVEVSLGSVDGLRYQQDSAPAPAAFSGELMHVRLRYKPIGSESSELIAVPVRDEHMSWHESSDDFRFTAAVAAFGMLLSKSENLGDFRYDQMIDLAARSLGEDEAGYRRQFLEIARAAERLTEDR